MAANNQNFTGFDELFVDEAYETSSERSSSYVTSISSYIRDGVEENGRKYAAYGKNSYGLPIDEREQERNDLQHTKCFLILGDRLHRAPITKAPSRILDLGAGSGIWAIEMADLHESAIVTGVDLAPVQPSWVPPNCQFEVLDIEDDWMLPHDSFDFIHARELVMSIRDWDGLFRQVLDHLKPGGYFEISSIYPIVNSDDGSLPPNSFLLTVERLFSQICTSMGTPMAGPTTWKDIMLRTGFADIDEVVYKIPQGVWPRDERLKRIGAYENQALYTGLEAYMLRGYTTQLGGTAENLQPVIAGAERELKNPRIHSYVLYYNVYGRKPESWDHDMHGTSST